MECLFSILRSLLETSTFLSNFAASLMMIALRPEQNCRVTFEQCSPPTYQIVLTTMLRLVGMLSILLELSNYS